MVGAPACGDVMKLQIRVNEQGVDRRRALQDLRLRLRDRVLFARDRVGEGKTLDQAETIRNTQIAEELALPR